MTVCDMEWGLPDADVTCQQLGYGYATMAWRGAYFGEPTDSVVEDFRIILSCTGKERELSECSHSKILAVSCGESRTAGVRCSNVSLIKGKSSQFVIILKKTIPCLYVIFNTYFSYFLLCTWAPSEVSKYCCIPTPVG